MRTMLFAAIIAIAALPIADAETPDEAAMRVLEDFMTAFNARDEAAVAATMHFPHVRIASGEVHVWETAEARFGNWDFDTFAERFNWDRSAWLSRSIAQSSDNKVHVTTTFARYDPEGSETMRFESLYIVAKIDGKWAIQGRSSFAP